MVDTSRICKRLQSYTKAYYSQLRLQFNRYAAIETAFPGFLTGLKRVQALPCTDGVLVVHWAADRDSFSCQVRQQTVGEVAKEVSGPGFELKYPVGEPMSADFGEAVVYEVSDGVEKLVWRSPWDKLEVAATFGASRWGTEYARTRADSDALTFVAGHLMQMVEVKEQDVLGNLDSVIKRFEDLLEQTTREEELQAFLAENPVVLSPAAQNIYPKHKLGKEHVCDFVIERAEADYVLVEIEAASRRLFTKKGDPFHELSHAQQQVEDWLEWVSHNTSYAEQSLPGISDPEAWVVIGRDKMLTGSQKVKLRRRNKALHHITIMTYDQLLNSARSHLDNLIRMRAGRSA